MCLLATLEKITPPKKMMELLIKMISPSSVFTVIKASYILSMKSSIKVAVRIWNSYIIWDYFP